MNNLRRNYFIDKSFQTKFILKFCGIVILASIVIGVILILFSTKSTTVAMENTKVTAKGTADFIFPLMLQTILIVTIFSAVTTSILTLFVSHKIAGPLFRLRREIEKLGEGNLNVNFNIREGDQLRNLATSLAAMSYSLRGKIEALRRDFLEIKEMIEKMPHQDKSQLQERIKAIESKFNGFKGL
ncbi:MAG: methyl-accepting chemotaxis protein [Candidatus Omnitrophota bacterium]|nr:methyl-accepting chemotaxis protein [Candidatus Omnitrophota bacterium]